MEKKKNGAGLIKHISERKYCVRVLTDRTEAENFLGFHGQIFPRNNFFFSFQFFICLYVQLGACYLVCCCRLLCLKSVLIHVSVFHLLLLRKTNTSKSGTYLKNQRQE